jgi:hypothetical protein
MEIGDRIRVQGMNGTVVALVSENKFAPGYPAEHWATLESGALILTDEFGLIHYPTLDEYEFEKILN